MTTFARTRTAQAAALNGIDGGVIGEGGLLLLKSHIDRDARLVKEAQIAGRSVQNSINSLVNKMAAGNLNPGIVTKVVFGNVFETRARDGARVYYRIMGGTIEVLAKSSKANQPRVISLLEEIYG